MDTRAKPATAENPAFLDRPAVSPATESFRALDHAKEAVIARMTGGLSPASLRAALADWLIHLAAAPGKQRELASLCAQNTQRITEYLVRTALGCYAQPLAEPSAGDSRFLAWSWQTEPYRFWQQVFLLAEQWWNIATRDVPGTTHHHENVVSFSARQLLDMMAPTNFPLTNPENGSLRVHRSKAHGGPRGPTGSRLIQARSVSRRPLRRRMRTGGQRATPGTYVFQH